MSLLEKAKSFHSRRHPKSSHEDIELAFAWLKDEVNGPQLAAAYGVKSGSAMVYKMATALKLAYQQGLIQISDKI